MSRAQKYYKLSELRKEATETFRNIDPGQFPCLPYFEAITKGEYAVNGLQELGYETSDSLNRFQGARYNLITKCIIPTGAKAVHRWYSAGFSGREQSETEEAAANYAEKAISADWRKGPCETIIADTLDAYASMGRVYAQDGEQPDSVRELKAILPKITKRCLRRTSEIQWKETTEDPTVTRGKLLELDGTSKRKSAATKRKLRRKLCRRAFR